MLVVQLLKQRAPIVKLRMKHWHLVGQYNIFICICISNRSICILHTDHLPLVKIIHNCKITTNSRIECLLLKIQAYEFKVVHQKDSTNPSDYLSRYPKTLKEPDFDRVTNYVNFLIKYSLPIKMSVE